MSRLHIALAVLMVVSCLLIDGGEAQNQRRQGREQRRDDREQRRQDRQEQRQDRQQQRQQEQQDRQQDRQSRQEERQDRQEERQGRKDERQERREQRQQQREQKQVGDYRLYWQMGHARALYHYKDHGSRYGVPMLKIRRSRDLLIFYTGIPLLLLIRRHRDIETPPGIQMSSLTYTDCYLSRHVTCLVNKVLCIYISPTVIGTIYA